jgi:hypothetical protein
MSQVRYEAERAREQAQKQLAATEGRAGVLHTRIDDVLADNRALKHKVSTLLTGSAGCCLQPVPDEPQHSQLWRHCLCILPSPARLRAKSVAPERRGRMPEVPGAPANDVCMHGFPCVRPSETSTVPLGRPGWRRRALRSWRP